MQKNIHNIFGVLCRSVVIRSERPVTHLKRSGDGVRKKRCTGLEQMEQRNQLRSTVTLHYNTFEMWFSSFKQHQDVNPDVVSRKSEKTGSEVINFTTSNNNCKKVIKKIFVSL